MLSRTDWILLILKLPGKSASARMRVWRALKTTGAAMLRDGVYVLPDTDGHMSVFNEQREEVRRVGGSAYVLNFSDSALRNEVDLRVLFDRGELFEDWLSGAETAADQLSDLDEPAARNLENRLRRELEGIVALDFFPTEAQEVAAAKLSEFSHAVNTRFSPGEPSASTDTIESLNLADVAGSLWATRADLWVDRVASAWLIKRFVDPESEFLWLEQPADCPAAALGFDFDGARFSHVGNLVTFQVLLRAFGLHPDRALSRIGEVVRYLDIGGPSVSDAAGFLSLLSGAKRISTSDDDFLTQAAPLFDHLYSAYGDSRAQSSE